MNPVLLVSAILAAVIAFAACPLVRAQGGPPMITDDTETVPTGHWEINSAFTVERTADGRLFGAPLLDINYGLSKNTQIKVEIPWLILHSSGQRSVSGLGNTNIGVRWRFRDETEHHRIALSIYPAFEFNNPNHSVRRGLVDKGPEFLMPLQWQTTIGKFGVNGDVGYRFKRGIDEMIYGVVIGRELNKRIEALAEVHATGPRQRLSEHQTVYNLGARVKLMDHASLIVSAGKSLLHDRDPRFIGYAGIQWTF